MMRYQRGSSNIASFFVALLIIAVVGVWIFETSPASTDGVREVVENAKSSPVATGIVAAGLKSTPTPTRAQLGVLRERVNEQLVLETAQAVTGDRGLRPASIAKSEQEESDRRAVYNFLHTREGLGTFAVIFVISFFLVFTAVNRWRRAQERS